MGTFSRFRRTTELKRSRLRYKADPAKKPCPPAEFRHPPIVRLDAKGMEDLRWQAFERSGKFCEAEVVTGRRTSRCMAPITWNSFHLAHILARSKGGSDTLPNVLCKCPTCHMGPAESDHPGPQFSTSVQSNPTKEEVHQSWLSGDTF